MENSRLEYYSNGTTIDPHTGLCWMIPLARQGWHQEVVQEQPALLTWHEATDKFGKGRLISATSADCIWSGIHTTKYHIKYQLSRDSYEEYSKGTNKNPFLGFNDWRLPTAEELWSLQEAGITPKMQTDHSDNLWTANPSTKGILATAGMGYEADWFFQGSNIYGDTPRHQKSAIRLVRQGFIFQTLF